MRYILTLNERDSLVSHSIQHYVEGRVQTAFQQFMEGLNTLKLAEAIQAHPVQFKGLFLENTQQLNAADLISLFQPVLSTVGSSRRQEESRVLCYWRDWLIDIEGGECVALHLEDILIFASGLSRIPPLGYPVQPTLEFLHPASNTTK
ncbi:G2/M phase-specific E3 ubiquitin-protein ligase-like [Onychostoma macrolepis]|uniref:G2/M phase-specific E3 ubiquitin-protein ligase-like n=1 Tax=Onychostoma macrolepis TaxID=369639 RepID=UPI00272A90AF|nr:G2/M phase-specific E3 ubiquitin-protein ligase-like [Onychostoma macrolepis]